MNRPFHNKLSFSITLAILLSLLLASWALASGVDVAVVDVTVPTNSVTLAPGGSGPITINITITGNQVGTATFEVYQDWTLSGGIFTGSNPKGFTVAPRAGGDPATTFSTTGTVTVATGQGAGTFTLEVGAFDITNSNSTGGKLAAGKSSNYQVTVTGPTVDTTPPVITLASRKPEANSNGWNNTDVVVTWTCTDSGSGVVAATVIETLSLEGASQSVTGTCLDNAGNKASDTQGGINIDRTSPTMAPSVSPDPIFVNGSATASPNASDNLSGVDPATASCYPVNTSKAGTFSVSCTATDYAGNTATAETTYTVSYKICVLYDQSKSHKKGSTVPIKLQLCDINGANLSDPSIILNAVSQVKVDSNASPLVEDSGNANPDSNFRYSADLAGYIFNLSTKPLSSGTWRLNFKVSGLDTTYSVKFDVR